MSNQYQTAKFSGGPRKVQKVTPGPTVDGCAGGAPLPVPQRYSEDLSGSVDTLNGLLEAINERFGDVLHRLTGSAGDPPPPTPTARDLPGQLGVVLSNLDLTHHLVLSITAKLNHLDTI